MSPPQGRDGIDAALDALYPDQVDRRYAGLSRPDGEPPSIVEFAVFASEEDVPHWHYVTYGLSEIFEKQTDDPSRSGYGLELTFRLARGDEAEPPGWPLHVLTRLADYVFDTGNVFGPLHTIALEGLAMRELGPALDSVLFVADRRLPEVDTSNGRCAFLQVVTIAEDEEALIARWDAERFAQALRSRSSMLVNRRERTSLLVDPEQGRALREQARREGSSRELEFLPGLRLEQIPGMNGAVRLTLDDAEAGILTRLLETRTAHARRATLVSGALSLQLLTAMEGKPAWTASTGEEVSIAVPPERVGELVQALARKGELSWPWFPELRIVRE